MSYIGTNGGNKALAQALPNWKTSHASQVGLHTTEFPVGHTLLGLFQFLNTRNTHGAYQAAADSHGSSGQYCPWSWAAWGAPSINKWAVHVAGNCRADEWDRMTVTQRNNLVNGMAKQAHLFSRWQVSQGRPAVPAKRLTKAQALRREAGFVYHGALQSDRSDPTGPRNVFPWKEFLKEYRRLERGNSSTPESSTPATGGNTMSWSHPIRSLRTNTMSTAETLVQHTHSLATQAAQRTRNIGAVVWRYSVTSAVSGNKTNPLAILRQVHLRVHQNRQSLTRLEAKVDQLLKDKEEGK